MNLQYTRDLSFEVPGAPEIFVSLREQPRVDIALDVQARPVQGQSNVYEGSLQVRADAKAGDAACFIAELA
jgi:preprotein translocase subunit SecB